MSNQLSNLSKLILFSLESDQLLLPLKRKAMPYPCACIHQAWQTVVHIRQSTAAIACAAILLEHLYSYY